MNWKASQLFWKLQSQPFSNCVLWHVPRSFIEGNMSSLPKTLGKLCTVSPLRLHSSIGEAFWSLAVEIFDYLSLSHCFLNLFNHRLAFFFFFLVGNSYSHLTGCCIFMELSFGYIAPIYISFSEIWVLRSCPAADIVYTQQFPSFFFSTLISWNLPPCLIGW